MLSSSSRTASTRPLIALRATSTAAKGARLRLQQETGLRCISAHASHGRIYNSSYRLHRQERKHEDGRTLATEQRKPLFDKILIANRGEIACRVMRTAKRLGIKTVAVYSEVDAEALHVKTADEAYCIGPAPSSESYLRIDKIIDVARRSGAQAIHPGYGFLSENAMFARRLAEEGLVFIGPSPSSIESMGSKSQSKDIMTAAGVPCVPGYHGMDQSTELLLREAERIGFPVLIKAVMGGGGKGMRIVNSASEFPDALESAQREARKSFGDERVLVEKYIVRPRHIEVQVFGDTHGNVVSLWERDCSVQRRHQKIIEEAPAPGLTEELRADLCQKAVAAAKAVDYLGAGTVEFILDNDTQKFYFMEMNTRLQVEHPVTEMITNQDLVEWQLEVASGNPLPLSQSGIPRIGHAFEARIYAENPRNNFLPDVGPLIHIATPSVSSSVRLEEGFLQGSNIEVFYDPLISKLVVHGRDRTEALRVLRKALEEYQIVGVSTNIEFLSNLAANKHFINGDVETGFIQKHHDELFPVMTPPQPEVLAQAALFVTLRDMHIASLFTSPWLTLGPRRFGGERYERTISFEYDTSTGDKSQTAVKVSYSDNGDYDIVINPSDNPVEFPSVPAKLLGKNSLLSTLSGGQLRTTIVSQPSASTALASASTGEKLHVFHGGRLITLRIPPARWVQEIGESVLGAAAAQGGVRAPMPSLVVDVKVGEGDTVAPGQALVVLESMKTETVLRAATAGVVSSVTCKKGEMVEEGKELVKISAPEEEVVAARDDTA